MEGTSSYKDKDEISYEMRATGEKLEGSDNDNLFILSLFSVRIGRMPQQKLTIYKNRKNEQRIHQVSGDCPHRINRVDHLFKNDHLQ